MAEKISWYTSTGWWVPTTVWQAVNGLRPLYAKWQYGKGCFALSRPRHHTTQHCMCHLQIQIGYVRGIWTNMYLSRRCPKDCFRNNLRHVHEPINAAGWLQCSIYLPEVDDCSILWIHCVFCIHISKWYIHILFVHQGAWETPQTGVWQTVWCTVIFKLRQSRPLFTEDGLSQPYHNGCGYPCLCG